jgi:hypothetical protein
MSYENGVEYGNQFERTMKVAILAITPVVLFILAFGVNLVFHHFDVRLQPLSSRTPIIAYSYVIDSFLDCRAELLAGKKLSSCHIPEKKTILIERS